MLAINGFNKQAVRWLRTACQKAKHVLSTETETKIELECLADVLDLNATITRTKFEELNADLFRGTLEPVEKALCNAKLDKNQVDNIVLIGGSCYKYILLSHWLLRMPVVSWHHWSSATQWIQRKNVQTFTAQFDGVVLLCDKHALDRSTQTQSAYSAGNASKVVIKVYEGERAMTRDNYLLGKFELTGNCIPSGQQIEVTFDIDRNCILYICSLDEIHNGRRQN